jgi:hypothetical protein
MHGTDTQTPDVTPADEDHLDREVPQPIAEALQELAGEDEAPRTLRGMRALARADAFSPGERTVDEMLTTDESRHRVHLPDRTVHTYCILDALVYPFLEQTTVEIETRPPNRDETIAFTASPAGARGIDDSMVVSFGFDPGLLEEPAVAEDASVAEIQDATHAYGCPEINLFPGREAYEAWAEDSDAVAMPLAPSQALALARDTVQQWEAAAAAGHEEASPP